MDRGNITFCFLIKSNLKQNRVSALTDDDEGKELMRKYLSGKSFQVSQLSSSFSTQRKSVTFIQTTPTTSLCYSQINLKNSPVSSSVRAWLLVW